MYKEVSDLDCNLLFVIYFDSLVKRKPFVGYDGISLSSNPFWSRRYCWHSACLPK